MLPSTRISYLVADNEKIINGYYAPEGYSKYYENKMRYNLGDAKAHKAELEEKGKVNLIIVRETLIRELVTDMPS